MDGWGQDEWVDMARWGQWMDDWVGWVGVWMAG